MKWPEALKPKIYWSDPVPQQRGLERITDLGQAYSDRIDYLTGVTDSSSPAVFRSRQLLSTSVAALPLQEVQEQTNTVIPETPKLLRQPDPTQTYHDFMSGMVLDLLDHGNAFLRVTNWDEIGNPSAVYICNPDETHVTWDRKQLYPVYRYRDQRMDEGTDFFHISINKKRYELLGKGPIEAARGRLLPTLTHQEEMALSLARDNYMPSVVLKFQQMMDGEERAAEARAYVEGRKAAKHGVGVAAGGAEIEQNVINPVDAQLVETLDWHIGQVGRLFGLHGYFLLVKSGDSLTYSTTESLWRGFLNATLRPVYLDNISQQFSRMLPSGKVARFNAYEVLQPDVLARHQAHDIAVGGKPFKTINEVRAEEGLSPMLGGDELLSISTESLDPAQRVPRGQLNGASGAAGRTGQ